MARTVVEYRCLLISPSDVDVERAAISEVVEQWNAQIGSALGTRSAFRGKGLALILSSADE